MQASEHRTRRSALRAATAAAVLVLAGCGPAAEEETPQPQPVELGVGELHQALLTVDVEGHQFVPVAGDDLRTAQPVPEIPADVEPAACRALLDESLRLQTGDHARASIVSDAMTVSVVAYPDETRATAQIEASVAVVETCPEMTTTAGGSTSTTVTAPLESGVRADQVAANRQSTGNAGLTLDAVTSVARSGRVLVTATVSSPPAQDEALADLDSAVQQTLDALPAH